MKATMIRMATSLFVFAALFCLFSSGENSELKRASSGRAELPDYTIKYLSAPMQVRFSDETQVGQLIKERFGIRFEFIPYTGDIKEKQMLMLAGADYNELQQLQGQSVAKEYISAGALLDLDDYSYALSDFYKRFEEYIPYWRLAADNGGLYKYETKHPLANVSNMDVNDIAVRTDALQKQGWPQPLSTDEWITFLKKALKNQPFTNGEKTIGITVPFAESYGLSGISQILYEKGDSYLETSDDCNIYNFKTGKFEDQFKNKYVKESLKFFNKLYVNGLLDEECFTDTADKTAEKLSKGQAIAVWYCKWLAGPANDELEKKGQSQMTYLNMPIQSNAMVSEGQKRLIRTETTRAFNAQGITKNAKYPERLAALINWACTDEGQIIIRSGVEGQTWTRDDKGLRIPTEFGLATRKSTKDKTASGQDLFFGVLPSFNLAAADGQYHNLFLEPQVLSSVGVKPRLQQAYDAYSWENGQSWYKTNGNYGKTGVAGSVTLDSTTDTGKRAQKMVDCRVKYTPKLIMASSDEEFERIYAEAMIEYEKLRPEEVIEEYNRMKQVLEAKLPENSFAQ